MYNRKPFRYPDVGFVIFARAPEYGRVKTRLAAGIGAKQALSAYETLLEQTVQTAAGCRLAPVELHIDGNPQHPVLRQLAQHYGATLVTQKGADLGERMYHALDRVLQRYKHAIIIGTDCPAMDARYLERAIRQLAQGSDVVIGPSEDGGYVLIGATLSDKRIFHKISWGSEHVMQQTRDALYHANLHFDELDTLWDVDHPEDYRRWQSSATAH